MLRTLLIVRALFNLVLGAMARSTRWHEAAAASSNAPQHAVGQSLDTCRAPVASSPASHWLDAGLTTGIEQCDLVSQRVIRASQ